jgi:ADP-ribose/NAD+ diphosphatase
MSLPDDYRSKTCPTVAIRIAARLLSIARQAESESDESPSQSPDSLNLPSLDLVTLKLSMGADELDSFCTFVSRAGFEVKSETECVRPTVACTNQSLHDAFASVFLNLKNEAHADCKKDAQAGLEPIPGILTSQVIASDSTDAIMTDCKDQVLLVDAEETTTDSLHLASPHDVIGPGPGATTQAPSSMNDPLVLPHAHDRFQGVQIDGSCLPADESTFETRLVYSLSVWQTEQVRGVWLRVFANDGRLLGAAMRHGFEFHHAMSDHATLCKWLQPGLSKLPSIGFTSLGIGGVVINSKREVLVILEKFTTIENNWKVPGGAVDRQEDLVDAAIREVREETGIDTEFVSIIGFRHLLRFRWGGGDIYFLSLLKPVDELQTPQPEEEEIAGIKWMPLEEWLEMPFIKSWNHHIGDALRSEVDKLYPSTSGSGVVGMDSESKANVHSINTDIGTVKCAADIEVDVRPARVSELQSSECVRHAIVPCRIKNIVRDSSLIYVPASRPG